MSSKNLGGPPLVTVVVLYIVVVAAVSLSLLPHSATADISCLEVELKVASCLPYVDDGGKPSVSCCDGINSLKEDAKSTSDRQETCKCLKKMATSISGKEADRAKDLPRKCHVHVPYPISIKTDCDKIK